jgi:hypothetical protein
MNQINRLGQCERVACVHPLQHHHTRVLPQPVVELSVANVNSIDLACPALEQAIGEAACGGTYVNRHHAAYIKSKLLESVLQLEPAPAHELRRLQQSNLNVLIDQRAGLDVRSVIY